MKEQRPDNWKRPRHTGNTAGSVLITVLGVSLIFMLAGATMLVLSRQSMHRVKRTVNYAQARSAAEAGVADMIAKLGTNYTAWQNTNYTAQFFTNGAYYVTTQTQLNGNVLITSDGIYMEASNRTIMELLGTLQTHYNELYDTNSVIMSGGDINIGAGNFTLNGSLYGNQNINAANGANGTISGDVSVVGSIDPDLLDNIEGTNNTGVPPIVLPPEGPFNFDSYLQLALTNGNYMEGDQDLPDPLPSSPLPDPSVTDPTNGILYVNGDLTISGNNTFYGTIVVNGDITINNFFTQHLVNSNLPSLLSTGSITLYNNESFDGVIYARVNVTVYNQVIINGGIISGGITDIRNNIEINPGNGYPVWDPLNPEVPPEVIVGGWLK